MDGKRLLQLLMDRSNDNPHSLSRKLGNRATQPQIYRFVTGEAKEPRRTTLAPIAEHYNVPVEAFYSDDLALAIALREKLIDPSAVEDVDRLFAEDAFGAAQFSRVSREPSAAPYVQPGLQQIRSWEHEEDLPEGEYAMVPRLHVKLSAGPGSGVNQLTFDFDDGQLRAYSSEWIRSRHLKPNKLRVMKGSGRSMEPTIFDGDDLLINLAETEIIDGRVYALWYEGGERVKRLYRLPGGGLRIRSDNATDFPEIVLGPEYTGHVRIIGRVIDRSGPGGL